MLNVAVERIKELKKERKLTDVMIGQITQYHHKHVNRMLNYKAKLPEDVIVPLSEYLEVSPEYLMGHSDFKTMEEQERHLLHEKYQLIFDLMTSIGHLNLSFEPYILCSKGDTSEREKIELIKELIDNNKECKEISSSTSISSLKTRKESQLYTCKEKDVVNLFLDYERNHMENGYMYFFHEVKHNGKRIGIISHERFLHMMDNINNTIANIVSLSMGFLTTEL